MTFNSREEEKKWFKPDITGDLIFTKNSARVY